MGTNGKGKIKLTPILKLATNDKGPDQKSTVTMILNDASAILESLLGQYDYETVIQAMKNQGFSDKGYDSTLGILMTMAKERRPLRLAGVQPTKAKSRTRA